jgi:hypothetical protein
MWFREREKKTTQGSGKRKESMKEKTYQFVSEIFDFRCLRNVKKTKMSSTSQTRSSSVHQTRTNLVIARGS